MTVRVKAPHGVERYPHFWITEGTGVVTEIDIHPSGSWSVWVHMDDHVDGCEEWDNEVNVWSDCFVDEVGIEEGFRTEFEPIGYAQYTIDGGRERYDLASFLSQDLSREEAMGLRTLRVGESFTIGGGAAAEFVITRVA